MNRTRLLILVGVVVAAAAIAGIVVAFAVGGASGPTTTTAAAAGPTASAAPSAGTSGPASAAPVDVLKGVPQHGDTLGSASAPATLEVFEDPQCPYCQEWALGTFPTVVQQYVKTGKVKLVYRGVEIIGPNSIIGLRAIYAAGLQNRLWNMVEQLYRRQGKENSEWITTPVLRSAAVAAGANPAQVLAQSGSTEVARQMDEASAEFQAAGAPGTPTFVVVHPPAMPKLLQLSGLDPTTFDAALDTALGR